MIDTEKIIKECASMSHSQKGDVSQHLLAQGFFDDNKMPESLKNRNKFPSGGNPVDVMQDFNRQNK